MSTPSLSDLIELGAVQDAQGLQGFIKIRPHATDPVALLSCEEIWLSLIARRGSPSSTEDAQATLEQYKVKQSKMHSGTVVMSLDGITNRDQAEALKGARILVGRAAFPKIDSDSYYWVDLIGCTARNLQDVLLGEVLDVSDNGAHGIIAIGDAQTKKVNQLVPFVKEWVHKVDLPNRLITLDWQSDW
jgi:16S rRNA processing protein RimM|uniref:ribosome maturation factor RimM n=1 Tax=Polynucleobacter sp. TaxID=2029855 RepID=UPI004047C3D3